jgi:hypothetical protein
LLSTVKEGIKMNQFVNHNNQGLPYPHTHPVFPVMYQELQRFQYPFINYDGPQWVLQNYMGVVQGLINVMQSKIGSNPLRTFMFNLMADGQYQNMHFQKLLKDTLDYMAFSVSIGANRDVVMAEQEAIPLMCNLKAATLIRDFPALCSTIDQQVGNMVMAACEEYNAIMLKINQFKMNSRMGNFQGNVQHSQQNNGGFGNSFPSQPFVGTRPNFQPVVNSFSMVTNTPVNRELGALAGGSKYSSDVVAVKPITQMQVASNVIEADLSPMAAMFNAGTTPSFNVDEVVMDVPAINTIVVICHKDCTLERLPQFDLISFYAQAYDPNKFTLAYNVKNNIIIGTNVIKLEHEVMEQDRHRIPTSFGNVYDNMEFTSNLSKVDSDLKELIIATDINSNSTTTEDVAAANELIKPYVDNNITVHTSLDDAWMALSLSKLLTEDTSVAVYRGYSIVSEIVPALESDVLIVRKYSEAPSYTALRDLMLDSLTECSMPVWSLCNIRMTDLINRTVKQQLGIPDLSIDNFVNDIDDLVNYIAGKYGIPIAERFLSKADFFIKSTLSEIDDDRLAILIEELLNIKGIDLRSNGDAVLMHLETTYCLTLIDVTSFELDISLPKNCSARVEKDVNPLLHTLLNSVFISINIKDLPAARVLIKTTDNRVLEACRGLLDSSVILLTIIK